MNDEKKRAKDKVTTDTDVIQNATEDGGEDQKIGNRSYMGTTPGGEPAGSPEGGRSYVP